MLNYSNILGGHHLEPHPRGRTSAAGFEDSTSVHPVGCARKEAEKIGRQSCQESGWSHTWLPRSCEHPLFKDVVDTSNK